MKGELTPEEINMNSIGMFRAGVDTVNTPIITEFIIIIIIINIIISTFIIINLRIITKLLRPHPRVSRYFWKWGFVFPPRVYGSSGQMRRYPTPHATIVTTEWILILLDSIAIIPARKKGKYCGGGTPYNDL